MIFMSLKRKSSNKVYIGTSGFSYSHWEKGIFYPKDLPKEKQLEYYARHFNTVEMNYPFYRLPSSKSFSGWKDSVPKGFVFSVKVSRYLTHIKHLHRVKTAWEKFLKRAQHLEEKLGPFLFQLPPNWKKNMDRLDEFMEMARETDGKHRFVLEFRNPDWFSGEVYRKLKTRKNIALCLTNSPDWPFKEIVTGDFVYVRMHGGKTLYSSNYSKKELKKWAEKIKKWQAKGLDIYIYFNNDALGYAVKNARTLKSMIWN